MTNPASDLRDLATWVDYCAEWIGENVGSSSHDRDRATRIVSFEAGTLNEFLIGFRRLGPELEQIASALDRPKLQLISGGKS